MILFPNDTLTLYTRGAAIRNGEGIITDYVYTLYKAVPADVQPVAGGDVSLREYGLSDLGAEDRVAFINNDPNVKPIMKAVSAKTSRSYELVQEQPWPNHTLIVLKPMQAGQVQ